MNLFSFENIIFIHSKKIDLGSKYKQTGKHNRLFLFNEGFQDVFS